MANNDIVKAGNLTRQSLSGIWLKNVFWKWQIYCVLKSDNRLEFYGNKRNYGNGQTPKTVVDLSTAACVCPADYIKPSAFLLLTGSVHICLSCPSIDDRDEWIAALNSAAKVSMSANMPAEQEPIQVEGLVTESDGSFSRQITKSSLYIKIWPVHILPSAITSNFQLHNRYWLAANNHEFSVLPYSSPDVPIATIPRFPFSTIRCCGGVGQTRVFFELGRQASTGEGTLWFQAISASAAQDMKNFISEFLTKRDGNSEVKKSKQERLIKKAKSHRPNISSRENIQSGSQLDEEAENNVPQVPCSDPNFMMKPVIPDERSYLEISPPKAASEEKKSSHRDDFKIDGRANSVGNRENFRPISSRHHDDVNNFAELNFGTDSGSSAQQHADVSSSVNAQPRESAPHRPSIQESCTPPIHSKQQQVKSDTVPKQLQIEKTSNGGDYVVVCAPKVKPVALQSKSQDSSSTTAASASTDDDFAPFLADDFQPGEAFSLAPNIGDFKQDILNRPATGSLSVSSGVSSVAPTNGPVQYVSLQINSDDANISANEGERRLLSAQPVSPQMSSVSVIYADLDFTSNSNNHSS